jgi:hypothetical protein
MTIFFAFLEPDCVDTPNWKWNGVGCLFLEFFHCPPQYAGEAYNYPELNCCTCGKGSDGQQGMHSTSSLLFIILILLVLLYVSIIILLFGRLFSYVEAVDCVWGEYGEWSTCSATCGGGTRTRTRPEDIPASNGGGICTGSATETGTCNPDACPGSKVLKAMPTRFLNTGAYL